MKSSVSTVGNIENHSPESDGRVARRPVRAESPGPGGDSQFTIGRRLLRLPAAADVSRGTSGESEREFCSHACRMRARPQKNTKCVGPFRGPLLRRRRLRSAEDSRIRAGTQPR
jgi:hypothetical protein